MILKKHAIFYGVAVLFFLIQTTSIATPAEELLKKVDKNMRPPSIKMTATMTIIKDKKKLIKSFDGIGDNNDNFFIEFTNKSDLGVKMLRRKNELWMYFPDADDVIKISGHLLRQSMMGSSMSYEDMIELENYQDNYSAKIINNEDFMSKSCSVLELTAKKNLTYYKQKLWVENKRYVVLKTEMYAKSGRLLRTFIQEDIRKVGTKKRPIYVPFKVTITDNRKKSASTQISYTDINPGIKLDKQSFSKKKLTE